MRCWVYYYYSDLFCLQSFTEMHVLAFCVLLFFSYGSSLLGKFKITIWTFPNSKLQEKQCQAFYLHMSLLFYLLLSLTLILYKPLIWMSISYVTINNKNNIKIALLESLENNNYLPSFAPASFVNPLASLISIISSICSVTFSYRL